MNSKNSSQFTLFQDRNLDGAVFPPRHPARLSTEPEGEGMELALRGLLIACLIAAMTICGAHLGNVADVRNRLPAAPEGQTAVAVVHATVAPVGKAL